MATSGSVWVSGSISEVSAGSVSLLMLLAFVTARRMPVPAALPALCLA
jgi:hypothetical protein